MNKFDATLRGCLAGYLGIALLLAVAARLGAFPGTGQAFAGQPLLEHPYRASMALVIGLLAVALGVLSAWSGRRLGSWTGGLALLVVGGLATGTALSISPWIYYPHDQYPVSFMWLVLGAPTGFLTWVLGTVASQRLPR